jgi:GrpB-like predicted nucleotidyltransferase (UPF0157 family)
MDEVIIVASNPHWQLLFDREVDRIRAIVDPDLITRIEHFGSTSVPGLAAKPIIDILVGVKSLVRAKQIAIAPLATLDYTYWYDNPDPERMFFVKGLPPNSPRTHHIHMVEPNSRMWAQLAFCEYLRQHPDEAARYARLKYQLAQQFTHDREGYTKGKTAYIESVMHKARQQSGFDVGDRN